MIQAILFTFLGVPLGLSAIVYLNYEYLKRVHNKRMIESLKTLVQNENSLTHPKIQEYATETIRLLI